MEVVDQPVDKKTFLTKLRDGYALENDFFDQLIPIVDKIFDKATPENMRASLLEQVKTSCARQCNNQESIKELKDNQHLFQENMSSLIESLKSIKGQIKNFEKSVTNMKISLITSNQSKH